MATRQKKWPHNAEWARLDSIAYADKGRDALLPLLRESQEIEVVRRSGLAIDCFRGIIDALRSVANNNNSNGNSK